MFFNEKMQCSGDDFQFPMSFALGIDAMATLNRFQMSQQSNRNDSLNEQCAALDADATLLHSLLKLFIKELRV